MTAYLSSRTKFKGNTLNSPSTTTARANAEETEFAPSQYRNSFTCTPPTLLTTSLKYVCVADFFTACPTALHPGCGECTLEQGCRRGLPSRRRGCRRDLSGCGTRGRTHCVSWIRMYSTLLRITGVDSRYLNARFQIWVGQSATWWRMCVSG